MQSLFTEQDKKRIQNAVFEAEKKTSGEIVPFFVPASGHYEVAVWRGAVIFAVLALFVATLIFQFYQGWGLSWLFSGWGTGLLTVTSGFIGGLVASYFPPLKRILAGATLLTKNVHRRALQAFVEEEVFNTRERTGILLFISRFERRIEVLGDSGINAKVSEDQWVDIVARIREGMLKQQLTTGLVEAIEMCGTLLEEKGVEIREDDTNELPDTLRMGDT